MSDRLLALGLNQAPNDTTKAILLSAIINFARQIDDKALQDEALSMMPQAHPFQPVVEWRKFYYEGFESEADESTGTYVDDMERYSVEFWQALTDEQRSNRLQNPRIGVADGIKDAEQLNACDLRTDSESEQ